MADQTAISWCDHTFNPWMGCTKVSPACKFCYAERDFDHRYKKVKWGPNGTRVVTSGTYWKRPLKWNADAEIGMPIWNDGKGNLARIYPRPRVFCASLADVFEDWDGPIHNHNGYKIYTINGEEWFTEGEYPECRQVTMDDVRRRLFKLIDATPQLDWLLLTKRPENIRSMWIKPVNAHQYGDEQQILRSAMLKKRFRGGAAYSLAEEAGYRSNVWLGTSTENQEYANKRIPELLKCRDLSPVLFLSCEPLLGSIDMQNIQVPSEHYRRGPDQPDDNLVNVLEGEICSGETGCVIADGQATVDWVIAGGESGPNARPSHHAWFRLLRDQCAAAGVPFHFKQLSQADGKMFQDFDSFPDRLQVREFPVVD